MVDRPHGAVGRRGRGQRVRDHRAGAGRDRGVRDRAVDLRARRAPGRGGAVTLLRRRARTRRRSNLREPLSMPGEPQFDDRAFESRLVWIFGSPRTGSTWLLRLLTFPLELTTERPSGSIMPRKASMQPIAVPVNEPYLPSHLTPIGNRFAEPGAPSFLLKATRPDDPNYFFADAFAGCWRPEVRRLILVRLHAQAELAAREHSLARPLRRGQGAERLPRRRRRDVDPVALADDLPASRRTRRDRLDAARAIGRRLAARNPAGRDASRASRSGWASCAGTRGCG